MSTIIEGVSEGSRRFLVTYWTGASEVVSAGSAREAYALIGYVAGDGSHLWEDGEVTNEYGDLCATIVPAPSPVSLVKHVDTTQALALALMGPDAAFRMPEMRTVTRDGVLWNQRVELSLCPGMPHCADHPHPLSRV